MQINYLTWLHEKTGTHTENIDLPSDVNTISLLMDHLESIDSKYQSIFKNRHVIFCAINNTMKPHETHIKKDDVLCFFSAMVGG